MEDTHDPCGGGAGQMIQLLGSVSCMRWMTGMES